MINNTFEMIKKIKNIFKYIPWENFSNDETITNILMNFKYFCQSGKIKNDKIDVFKLETIYNDGFNENNFKNECEMMKFISINDYTFNIECFNNKNIEMCKFVVVNEQTKNAIENYQNEMENEIEKYYKNFRNNNKHLFVIPCDIVWGIHNFKNLGECFMELDLSIQMCDSSEKRRYKNEFNKIMKMWKNNQITPNKKIILE